MPRKNKQLNMDDLLSKINKKEPVVTVTKSLFQRAIFPKHGAVNIYKYTLDNGFMSVDIINYGATITSIMLPDRNLRKSDIVLGFDTVNEYLSERNPYIGCTVGRVANRISDGFYEHEGNVYFLSKNHGNICLHGGVSGFDKKVWDHKIVNGTAVLMTYNSPDLEEGFPGDLEVTARFALTEENFLIIKYNATTNKTTPVNIVNHSYFNLAGHETGQNGLFEHELKIYADTYTELKPEDLVPTGEIVDVTDTVYDFTNFRNLGDAIAQTKLEGFDINYIVRGKQLRTAAKLKHDISGRSMQVYTNNYGVQLYTGNYLSDIPGKGKSCYRKQSGLCLETQGYPNSVNVKTFPPPWLRPREIYEHIVVYHFRVAEQASSETESEYEDEEE